MYFWQDLEHLGDTRDDSGNRSNQSCTYDVRYGTYVEDNQHQTNRKHNKHTTAETFWLFEKQRNIMLMNSYVLICYVTLLTMLCLWIIVDDADDDDHDDYDYVDDDNDNHDDVVDGDISYMDR